MRQGYSRKGQVTPFIIIGLFVAAIFFHAYLYAGDANSQLDKGAWQSEMADFEMQISLAELQLLEDAFDSYWEAVNAVALQGGHVDSSECYSGELVAVWNDGFCYPNGEAVLEEFQENWNPTVPRLLNDSTPTANLRFNMTQNAEQLAVAAQNSLVLSSEDQQFSVEWQPAFVAFVGYDPLAEYQEIVAQAQELVAACSSAASLRSCLDLEKEESWSYGLCNLEAYQESERQVSFCVEQPGLLVSSEYGTLEYQFALDFKPGDSNE